MGKYLPRLVVLVAIISAFALNVSAYSRSYSYSFDTGGVDGSNNNIYYSFNKGTVYLTNNKCYMAAHASTGGIMKAELLREQFGFNHSCGYKVLGTVTSTNSDFPTNLNDVTFNADQTSNRYYLYFTSQNGPTFVGSGTISQ